MKEKRKSRRAVAAAVILAVVFAVALFFCVRGIGYRRPYREVVEKSETEAVLVYAVMKAESGFCEDAVSKAGAVGLMQLLPSTAEFVCRMNGMEFERARLTEGEYNAKLGCLYLNYLLGKFEVKETAVAAYNAGEGTVAEWLKNNAYSADGQTLKYIPYPETARYVKKVMKIRKIYRFFYH